MSAVNSFLQEFYADLTLVRKRNPGIQNEIHKEVFRLSYLIVRLRRLNGSLSLKGHEF